ncbi:serine hydrolase domain-containing protein [Pedobacter nanyangensis]|uniref:serine hydrolase domain-containing protein n=1 Tax=Pedobacter nanyangensis TaxID=1562389 RepID=UPI000DE3CE7A|nr:serine hydrolase domain-containing protein [Pedobacter nanyangensis]
MMMISLGEKAKFCLVLSLFIAVLASCSKKNDPVPGNPPNATAASAAKEIINISILKAENANLTGNGYYFKSASKIYITIPLNSNLNNVKVNFTLSSKATIKVDGIMLANNTGNLDLSKTLTAVVTAENGDVATYTILAQIGIKEIDEMIYPFIEKYNIPAASYAIGKNSVEDIIYKNACGFANVDAKERAQPDYEFRLASMTKQHTSIAVMTLVQQGKIGLNDLVFGPTGILKASFPTVGPKSAKVTVKHLLEHTAGYYLGDPMFSSSAGTTLDQKIQTMLGSAQNEPGTSYYYYNMGYGVLGKIIELVSGKEYGAYLKEIYTPAGVAVNLTSSSPTSRRAKEAICYPQGSANAYGNDVQIYKAAGGVSINVDNLFKVLYAVDGGAIKPDILNAATRTLMFTKSPVANYTLGWRTGHSLFEGFYHGGNLIGTATFWIYGPEYSVAILLNSRSTENSFDTDLIVLTNNVMRKAKDLNL